jgi:hypothetical protein
VIDLSQIKWPRAYLGSPSNNRSLFDEYESSHVVLLAVVVLGCSRNGKKIGSYPSQPRNAPMGWFQFQVKKSSAKGIAKMRTINKNENKK